MGNRRLEHNLIIVNYCSKPQFLYSDDALISTFVGFDRY